MSDKTIKQLDEIEGTPSYLVVADENGKAHKLSWGRLAVRVAGNEWQGYEYKLTVLENKDEKL